MIIRKETNSDETAIRRVQLAAFEQSVEADLIEALRLNGDGAISLIAEIDNCIVGHIYYSKLVSPYLSLALAPIGVLPEYQSKGIGTALINAGQELAASLGYERVFVLGEPQYYEKFGFDLDAAKVYASIYAGPYFMVKHLSDKISFDSGDVKYATPFEAL